MLLYDTDPLDPDTDDDRLSDGDEVKVYKTDPTDQHSDFDELADGDEVLVYHTDPLAVDTDKTAASTMRKSSPGPTRWMRTPTATGSRTGSR